jgi:glycosyltransferase involved in cell wall biosynthesis
MTTLKQKPSICIVCHQAYGALCGGDSGHIGGIERHAVILAQWLAKKGYDVSMLTWNEGGDEPEVVNGVRVIRICRKNSGLPGLRFIHPKWTSLVRGMRQANADIYYQHGAECVTGQVALWCRGNGKRFVFNAANDTDCAAQLPELPRLRERLLYRYGLRHADVIISQTDEQRAQLLRDFELESAVLRYACHDLSEGSKASQSRSVSRRVLWIARGCRQKRPDRLLDLAELCPEFTFDLVGPFYPDTYSQRVYERALQIDNVVLHGAVSRDKVPSFYQNAFCMCCTSDYEGFPNTFLEAWSHALPIISTFDPDSLIAKKGIGFMVEDVPQMAAALKELSGHPDQYQTVSRNARGYFLGDHTLDAVMPHYEIIFINLAQGDAS